MRSQLGADICGEFVVCFRVASHTADLEASTPETRNYTLYALT